MLILAEKQFDSANLCGGIAAKTRCHHIVVNARANLACVLVFWFLQILLDWDAQRHFKKVLEKYVFEGKR